MNPSTSPIVTETQHNLADGAAGLASQARPLLKRASEEVSTLAHQGLDAWHSGSQQVRDRTQHASDTTVSYIKDKPYTSVLIAAAGGAALMAVAAMLTRSRYRD